MPTQIFAMLASVAALTAGLIIGLGFGLVQDAARRRNEKRQQANRLSSGWMVMPGSGMRVAMLLMALVLVQVLCPLLFVPVTKWWVSAGLVTGYGFILYKQLRERLSRNG